MPDFYNDPEEERRELVASTDPGPMLFADEPEEMGDEPSPPVPARIADEVSDEPASLEDDDEQNDELASRLHESSVRDVTPGPPSRRPSPHRYRPRSPLLQQHHSDSTSSTTPSTVFCTPPSEMNDDTPSPGGSLTKPSRPSVDTTSLAAPAQGAFGIVVESPGGGREEFS